MKVSAEPTRRRRTRENVIETNNSRTRLKDLHLKIIV
jgi:hypothetical protein